MNFCVQFFDGSVAVEVPRTRFHPIRDTADLLLFSVRLNPAFVHRRIKVERKISYIWLLCISVS
jgi:hypothetical protein